MPTLYEYLGIKILFYSDEHEPIHVHGRYNGAECRAEILLEEGTIINVVFKNVRNRKHLPPAQRAEFEAFVREYADEIVQKWIDYFVLQKKISPQIITKRL
ncbi:MAG: DUF4160 domain-containing protein [Candidatus Kapaibacterium sp.]|nr:MAG: DUF4160 domain-containing protein [Candidatus Kapabacteria bacterium]